MTEPTALLGTGILGVQLLLLWRMRAVEREQHYYGLLLHWVRNALVAWAYENKIDLSDPPQWSAP